MAAARPILVPASEASSSSPVMPVSMAAPFHMRPDVPLPVFIAVILAVPMSGRDDGLGRRRGVGGGNGGRELPWGTAGRCGRSRRQGGYAPSHAPTVTMEEENACGDTGRAIAASSEPSPRGCTA